MNEQNRRDHYRTEYAKLTPFQIEGTYEQITVLFFFLADPLIIPAMDDTASYCEVSASNIRDRGPNLNRDDVNQFLLLIKEYLSNNDIQSAMGSPLGQLSSRVQSPYNHQTSPLNTSYTLKGSSPSMSRNPSQSRAFDSKPEKIINQLMSMNDDLNALRHQFLESVDKSCTQNHKYFVSEVLSLSNILNFQTFKIKNSPSQMVKTDGYLHPLCPLLEVVLIEFLNILFALLTFRLYQSHHRSLSVSRKLCWFRKRELWILRMTR
jgi:hypothetical protein